MKWLSNNKKILFGNINFKDPMNDKRFDQNIKSMNYFDWIWFNPGAFKLIFIGRYFLTICVLGFFLPSILNSDNLIIKVIVSLYTLFLLYRGIRAIRKYWKTDVNFYDLYIRDYDE